MNILLRNPNYILAALLFLISSTGASADDRQAREIASWSLPPGAYLRAIATRDGFIYIAAGSQGLEILDASNPSDPKHVGGAPSNGGFFNGISLQGHYAYISDPNKGMHIFDITTPANPQRVGGFPKAADTGIFTANGAAYILMGGYAIQRVDVSDPANPFGAGAYFTNGSADFLSGIPIGPYLYVADGDVLRIIGSSDMVLKNTYFGERQIRHIAAVGPYVAISTAEFTDVLDVTDPLNPLLIQRINERTVGLVGSSGFLYSIVDAGARRLSIYDHDSLRSGTPIGMSRADSLPVNLPSKMAAFGKYLIFCGSTNLSICDFPPANPQRVSQAHGTQRTFGVFVKDSRAYVADGIYGLKIVDISNPVSPALLGAVTDFPAYDVTVESQFAYVAAGVQGLKIVDVTSPSNPTLASSSVLGGGLASSVAISNQNAFVAEIFETNSALNVINISDPSHPTLLTNLLFLGIAENVALSGKSALVAAIQSGLQIIDISTPASPRIVGEFKRNHSVFGVTTRDSTAYLANGLGLVAVDFSNPSNPQQLGAVDFNPSRISGQASNVSLSGNYAYVADWLDGVKVVDISNPANLRVVGGNALTFAGDIFADQNRVYIANHERGLLLMDLFNETPPPPQIEPLISRQPGAFRMLISGPAAAVGKIYRGTTVDNLTEWTPLTLNTNGFAEAIDTNAAPQRFYQFASP